MPIEITDQRESSLVAAAATSSIIELDNNGRWRIESESIRSVLAEYYGADVGGEELVPPADPAHLRSRLRAGAPHLVEMTDEVRRTFDLGACGILITKLGLTSLSLDDQRKVIFGLSALLGDVTWTHPVDRRVVCDVKNQGEQQAGAAKYSSFSENDREAEYHTDASFAAYPDRYFLLYSVHQAECGGGQTFLTDGRALLRELDSTPEGRTAIDTLAQASVPMRVPRAFRDDTNCETDGYQYAPIVSKGPMWRFRKDKIEKGLVARPQYASTEIRKSLDVVYELLESRQDEFRRPIPDDGVLIVDNHVALHGRTAFDDPGRHLLRARFHQAAG